MGCGLARLALVALIGLTEVAFGQSKPETSAGERADYAPIALRVACGGLYRTPCIKVLPRIAAHAARAGLELKPEGSGRTYDTAAAICEGQAAAAIVQGDAVALVGQQPSCLNRYDVVGRPLYPYYAFLVVRGDAPFHQFDDMAAENRRRLIMAGGEGAGGQITLGFLLRADPVLQRAVTVLMGDLVIGLQRVAGGSLDGFFAVEPLDSETMDRVRRQRDAHGAPLYKFIDIRPGPEFFRAGGRCLYRVAALDYGGAMPVTTVSLDAVMVLGRGFRDAHARGGPHASDVLPAAIDASAAAILADMKSPPDWRPAATSCQ